MKLVLGQEDSVLVVPRQVNGSSLRVLGLDLINTKAPWNFQVNFPHISNCCLHRLGADKLVIFHKHAHRRPLKTKTCVFFMKMQEPLTFRVTEGVALIFFAKFTRFG